MTVPERAEARRMSCRRLGLAVPVLVATGTILAFLPTLWNGFVSWDDPRMFLDNPHFRGLGLRQFGWAWTTLRLGEYMPITWLSYEADYALWGLRPFGYHLTSLLLHVGATLGVYALAWRLLTLAVADGDAAGVTSAAGLAALVFAVHPLRAEAVAWVSARGTVLGGLFAVLAVLAYVAGARRAGPGLHARGWLLGSLGLFVLALLSRATTLALPAALVVLDVYPLGRLGRGRGGWLGRAVWPVWREKLGYAAAALAMVPIALLARVRSGDPFHTESYDALAGLAVGLHGAAFYLWRTIVPVGLSPIYEMPVQLNPWEGRFVLGAVTALGVTGLLVAARRAWPAGLAAWVAYLALLLPVSGLVPFGLLQLAANRYTYLPCVGWAILAGAGWLVWCRARQARRVTPSVFRVTAVLCLVVIGGLVAMTWSEVGVWRDGRTLWSYAVLRAPTSAVAQHNLGAVWEAEGVAGEAAARYRRAVEIWPGYAPFRVSLARALAIGGDLDAAVAEVWTAIRLRPRDATGHVALGVILVARGDMEAATDAFEAALRLDPDAAAAHRDLAYVLSRRGREAEARAHRRRALDLDPTLAAREALSW